MPGEVASRLCQELRLRMPRVTRSLCVMRARSERLFADAQQVIPGGVNSPVRSWRAVGGHPVFIERAAGASVTDVDGETYVDFVGSWGPMVLGPAHPDVVAAVTERGPSGPRFG